MRRLNKEYKLNLRDDISLKYGSVNRDNPLVVYVTGKCWVSPLKKMEYNTIISIIESTFKNNIKNYVIDGENFENKLILDFDINTDNMDIGQKKFLMFDFYLRQNEENKKDLKSLKKIISKKVKFVIEHLIDDFNENNFSITLKK